MLESSVDKEKKKDHPDDYHIEWSILLNIIGTKILRFFILKEWKKRIIPFVFSLVKKKLFNHSSGFQYASISM
jgi:hypothetical protein